MFDLLAAGGWVMPVIVLCSVIALGISIERSVALNPDRIAPPHLLANVWKQLKAGELDAMPRLMMINLARLVLSTVVSVVVLYLLLGLIPA